MNTMICIDNLFIIIMIDCIAIIINHCGLICDVFHCQSVEKEFMIE